MFSLSAWQEWEIQTKEEDELGTEQCKTVDRIELQMEGYNFEGLEREDYNFDEEDLFYDEETVTLSPW